jgi:DNA invertase Pin-like site-specific DNA recombinase
MPWSCASRLRDLANIAHEIDTAGAHLRVLEQSVDTSTSAGRAFFGMVAVFAQFETDVRRERQAEGIVKAKKAGVYKGGTPRINRTEVREMSLQGQGPAAVARALGVSRMSIYRILREVGFERSTERPSRINRRQTGRRNAR